MICAPLDSALNSPTIYAALDAPPRISIAHSSLEVARFRDFAVFLDILGPTNFRSFAVTVFRLSFGPNISPTSRDFAGANRPARPCTGLRE
jgi:hypothetical protein